MRTLALILLLATASARATDEDHVLVHYDFDRDTVETRPYTLMVFEHSAGTVQLTETYRHSGFRSVEIRDVAGDGDFAELQGYFPDRPTGKLFVRFALMTAAPLERFNVAFAGPAHFTMRKNGIGFWLKGRDGVLHHVSAGEDRPLLDLRSFIWYVTDLTYDIDAGTYDLVIREERDEGPVIDLRGQPNAVGKPSMIHKFSFIGDIPGIDSSNAHWFVDDILVSADLPVVPGPIEAPRPRNLIEDKWG